MSYRKHQRVLTQVRRRLAEVLGLPPERVRLPTEPGLVRDSGADAVLQAGGFLFVVEVKASGAAGPVATAIEQALRYTKQVGATAIPLVVVPYMGDVGKQRCQAAGVSWMDLSGNARIEAPGLRILLEGRPNRFRKRGRPSSPFAPKSSRVVRWLLMHPDGASSQRQLARAVELDEGLTSRVLRRLEDQGLIVRGGGQVRARDPDLLLDAWSEDYDFTRHVILRGHVPARTAELLLDRLLSGLRESVSRIAATGLAGAWLLTHFAGFRLVTLYVDEEPPREVLDQLSFAEDARGANTWLVIPNDEGVFHGLVERHGVPVAHPIQVYLDLRQHPERSREAAEHLRRTFLAWRAHD